MGNIKEEQREWMDRARFGRDLGEIWARGVGEGGGRGRRELI